VNQQSTQISRFQFFHMLPRRSRGLMDGYPRWREILQHRAIFSVLIELIVPTMPKAFAHTNNPWNVVAYLAGGLSRESIGRFESVFCRMAQLARREYTPGWRGSF
jgi:hypothetical protein